MLQLLLERGQSYADLASLLGVDEAGVRARARAALTELAGADPDRNVGLTDYLLGQADPIGRADAVRHLKDDPHDLELATELTQKLRLVAPAGRAAPPAGRGVAAPAPASAAPCSRPAPDSRSPAAKANGGAVARGRSERRGRGAAGPADDPVQAPDPARWSPSAAAPSWWWRSFWPSPERSAAGAMTARHRRPPARPPTSRELRPAGLSGDRHQGPEAPARTTTPSRSRRRSRRSCPGRRPST